MNNANWFNAMVEFHNTVKYIRRNFDVPTVIAEQIQSLAATRQSQYECEAVAKASRASWFLIAHNEKRLSIHRVSSKER